MVRGVDGRTAIRVTLPEQPKVKSRTRILGYHRQPHVPKLYYFNNQDYTKAQDAAVSAAIDSASASDSDAEVGNTNHDGGTADGEQGQPIGQPTTSAGASVHTRIYPTMLDEEDALLATDLSESNDSGKEMPTGSPKHKYKHVSGRSDYATSTAPVLAPVVPAAPLIRDVPAFATPRTRKPRSAHKHDDLSIDGNASLNLLLAEDGEAEEEYLCHGRWYKVMGTERPEWIEDRRWVQLAPPPKRRNTGKWRELGV